MKNEIDALAMSELDDLHHIIFDIIKIPEDVFKECVHSAMMLRSAERIGQLPTQKTIEREQDFARLCAAAAPLPEVVVSTLGCTYSLGTLLVDDRNDGDDDLSRIKSLMAISFGKGVVISAIVNNPSTAESDRREMLSMAGALGAKSKNKPFAELKRWGIKSALGMKGANRDVARQLANQLPAHLADVSDDAFRLIYDAIRAQKDQTK